MTLGRNRDVMACTPSNLQVVAFDLKRKLSHLLREIAIFVGDCGIVRLLR